MVKQLKILLDDAEHEELMRKKGNLTWREYLLKKEVIE